MHALVLQEKTQLVVHSEEIIHHNDSRQAKKIRLDLVEQRNQVPKIKCRQLIKVKQRERQSASKMYRPVRGEFLLPVHSITFDSFKIQRKISFQRRRFAEL